MNRDVACVHKRRVAGRVGGQVVGPSDWPGAAYARATLPTGPPSAFFCLFCLITLPFPPLPPRVRPHRIRPLSTCRTTRWAIAENGRRYTVHCVLVCTTFTPAGRRPGRVCVCISARAAYTTHRSRTRPKRRRHVSRRVARCVTCLHGVWTRSAYERCRSACTFRSFHSFRHTHSRAVFDGQTRAGRVSVHSVSVRGTGE